MLVKGFYMNMTMKSHKEDITIETTVKRTTIRFVYAVLAHIAAINNEGNSITFGSATCTIPGNT